jgi:hypothetical protein
VGYLRPVTRVITYRGEVKSRKASYLYLWLHV